MLPRDPDLIDSLAAEYVLGTLRGTARRRLEHWRRTVPQVEERCRFWENNLMPLAQSVRPVQPPPQVWRHIQERLNFPPARQRRRAGPALAIAASVLLVAGLSLLLYWRSVEQRVTEVATITTQQGVQAWEVDVYRGRLVVHAGHLPTRPSDREFELWALPAGGKPVSLGVLPGSGTTQRALTELQRQALANTTQVAVTLEPLGGSPTGQPTSTPLFVAPLRPSGASS